MNINPVLAKELKINVRSVRTTVTLLIFNTILAAISLLVFYSIIDMSWYSGGIDYRSMITLYITMASIEFAMFSLIVPAITASGISGERERQTLDLLLTTKMKPLSIILGKLMASLSTVCILAISTLPILSLVFVYGGLRLIDLLGLMLYLIITAIFFGSIGLLISSVIKRTTGATVVTYALIILLFLGTIFLVGFVYLLDAYRLRYIDSNVEPSVGPLIYILLINPGFTYVSMISEQVGEPSAIISFLNQFGNYKSNLIIKNWLYVSCAIQLAISAFFIWLASRAIDPIFAKHKVKKSKKVKKIKTA